MMGKVTKYDKASPQTHEEALKMAKATQRPGQTKEQTKLIAQGIEKGINLYKKQQKVKSRELNRKINKVSRKLEESGKDDEEIISEQSVKSSFFPWILLLVSWVGFLAYLFLF